MSVKKLLYDYPSYKNRIQNLKEQKLKIDGLIEKSYPNCTGNYSQEMPNYTTNVINSTTETHAIRNIQLEQRELNKINQDIEEHQRVVYAIERALNNLRRDEREMIELRYFKKKKWAEIVDMGFVERTSKRAAERGLKTLDLELRYTKPIGIYSALK